MDKSHPLLQPVVTLSGIGAGSAGLLEKLGIIRVQDLLFHLPIRYEDRTRVIPIGLTSAGFTSLIAGTIVFIDVLPRGRKSLICRLEDSSGSIDLRFFHFTARQHAELKPGAKLSCFGEIRYGYAGLEMVHPDYRIISHENAIVTEAHLTPVYPLTQGLHQSTLRKAVDQALSILDTPSGTLTDWLSAELIGPFSLPSITEALKFLHAPPTGSDVNAITDRTHPAIIRLAFEELLSHQLSLKCAKQIAQSRHAPVFRDAEGQAENFINALPFRLTEAQQKVVAEIRTDFSKSHPMMRLVQGDVGSGKTVVAAIAAVFALDSAYQVAVMAPTELLAEQHYRNFGAWFQARSQHVVLLTGQSKGQARKQLVERISNGSAEIVIGTHALFQDGIHFHKLGLIIIDEQHRFGVHQRLALRAKGEYANIRPHQLVMTATPIPRTLAMLQYSDMDISIIDQLPPGRKPVTTSAIPNERRDSVIARIGDWVAHSKQAYWVCTLIEESEILQCEAAEKTAERLIQALPGVRIALLHGRIKPADKDAVMRAFKQHDIDLLVATTVIEVGVDVPNASLMIIENPERLGLSQLHQLRGRVGRGADESFCLLLYQPPLSDTARHRLGILRESNDGFYIAEKDLYLRGPGEVMGTRQTGQLNFKVADLVRDADLLDNIVRLADTILARHPDIAPPLIERWLNNRTDYSEV